MTDSTFTFRVDEGLKEAFNAAARERDRSAAQILRAAMRDFVAAQAALSAPAASAPPANAPDAWLRAKIERSRAAIGSGRVYGEGEMAARMARFRATARAATL